MKRVSDALTSSEAARYEAQKLAFAPLMFHATLAMRDLGVLDHLYAAGAAGATPDSVATRTGLSHYAASILLEAGFASGLCSHENRRFSITKMGVFWLKDRLTRVNADFNRDVCYRGASHFQEAMRSGLPSGLRELGPWPTLYEGLSKLPSDIKSSWFAFDHYYSDGVFEQCAELILSPNVKHLVDLGGNTGLFCRVCLAASPDVRISIADLPGQLAMADAAFNDEQKRRVDLIPVNFLDDTAKIPEGADVYWMSQFLDCFSESEIVSILRRVRDAMPNGGRAYILETLWDKQRYEAARYCVIGTSLYFACMANGNSRMYHSEDLKRLIKEAGLTIANNMESIGLSHTLIECVR